MEKDKTLDSFESQIEFIPSPNFSNRTKKIDMIVIHHTAASRIGGTISWFKNEDSKVSAHYIIGKDGRTVQMVKDDKKAWHAGVSYWQGKYYMNTNSIGIELVGNGNSSSFTDYQYESLIALCKLLIRRWDIPLDRIVGHQDISGEKVREVIQKKSLRYTGKTDPGKYFNWEILINSLEEVVPEEKRILSEEPIIDTDPELFKPQKDMGEGKDPFDGSIIGIILDLIRSLFRKG